MKRCPTCQRTFTDETQKFCANDGTPLVNDEPAFDPEATVMSLGSQLSEEPSSPTPPPPQPPPAAPFYNPGAGTPSQPDPNIHQSSPPPSPMPGALPTWQPPQQPQQPQQQQPYYPQPGMPGGQQPPPQWQGGQQQPPWMPPGQQPQGQNWGGGFNQPGQYAPYGASPAAAGSSRGTSKAATISLISGIISFLAIVGLFIIIGARIRDLRDLIEPLGWLSLATGLLALILGIVGLITGKATSSKVKAGIGIFLGIIPLVFFLIGVANRM